MTFFYGPGDWLGSRFTARTRRAIAAWTMILLICPVTPVTYLWKDQVWMIWLVSMVALVLAMWGVVSAETPVEKEQ